jgi:hypothetical protein
MTIMATVIVYNLMGNAGKCSNLFQNLNVSSVIIIGNEYADSTHVMLWIHQGYTCIDTS